MRPLVAFVSFFRGDEKVHQTRPLALEEGMRPKSKAIAMPMTVSLALLEPVRDDCQVTVLDPETQKAASAGINLSRCRIQVP